MELAMDTLLVIKNTIFLGNPFEGNVRILGLSDSDIVQLVGSVDGWGCCMSGHLHGAQGCPHITFGRELEGLRVVICVNKTSSEAIERIKQVFDGRYEQIEVEDWVAEHGLLMFSLLDEFHQMAVMLIAEEHRVREGHEMRARIESHYSNIDVAGSSHPELN